MKRSVLLTGGIVVVAVAAMLMLGVLAADSTVVLAVTGRVNSTVSIATDQQRVVVAWSASMAGATDIYTATSSDGGIRFAAPVRVNGIAGNASVTGEQPPRIVFVPRPGSTPAIVVVWTAKSSRGTRILTARSDDGGRSFGVARALSGSEAEGNRGWESIAADADGGGVVVWLDHRELAAPAVGGKPMTHDHAAMSMPSHDPVSVGKEQLSKLYVERLDGSGTATALTGGVCYCCKTSVVAGPAHTFYAVWRHVYPGNIRDIAFTMSRDGGRTFLAPVRVSEDRWMLDGCPENGPALTTSGKDVIVVWPTLVAGSTGREPTMQLFYATTRDGKSFTRRMPMPTEGVPRHPQIATLANGSVVAAWDEAANGRRRVVLASKSAAMMVFAGRRVVVDADTAEYPAIATVGSGMVVAWTSGPAERSVIRVARLEP